MFNPASVNWWKVKFLRSNVVADSEYFGIEMAKLPNTALSGDHWFGDPKSNVLDVDASIAEDSLVQAIFHRPPDAGTCLARVAWLARVGEDVHIHLFEVYVKLDKLKSNQPYWILFVMNRSVNFVAVDLWSRKFDIFYLFAVWTFYVSVWCFWKHANQDAHWNNQQLMVLGSISRPGSTTRWSHCGKHRTESLRATWMQCPKLQQKLWVCLLI